MLLRISIDSENRERTNLQDSRVEATRYPSASISASYETSGSSKAEQEIDLPDGVGVGHICVSETATVDIDCLQLRQNLCVDVLPKLQDRWTHYFANPGAFVQTHLLRSRWKPVWIHGVNDREHLLRCSIDGNISFAWYDLTDPHHRSYRAIDRVHYSIVVCGECQSSRDSGEN